VLLSGKGVVDTSARSLLRQADRDRIASIGTFIRKVLDECYQDFQKATAPR
jgi:hypothetical protein